MELLPAIDMIDGCAVRLTQGNYDAKKVYDQNPVDVAKRFEEAGALWIHMVDLDGARLGTPKNAHIVEAVASKTNLHIEIGGGVRTLSSVASYLDAGASRAIIGTAAVKDPEFLKQALSTYKEQVAVGVDVLDEYVRVSGWEERTEIKLFDFCKQLESLELQTLICTDISKDGMLGGTNVVLYERLVQNFSFDVIASGGISSVDDLGALIKCGAHGAILGKAMYEGVLSLQDALAYIKGEAK